MKHLALAFIATAGLAAPAFACPNSDHESAQATATAKQDDKAPAKAEQKKADAPKADTAKAAKTSKDTQKKPDKVSSK